LCGADCIIHCLAVFIQYWHVADTQTHRHTITDNTMLPSIASRDKNKQSYHTIFIKRAKQSIKFNLGLGLNLRDYSVGLPKNC